MITTVLRIGLLRLRNNPLEILLMFVVPIVFFSIFAVIFGRGIGSGKTAPVRTLIVNEDRTTVANEFIDTLIQDPSLAVTTDKERESTSALGQDEAISRIRSGTATVAIVIPQHFGDNMHGAASPHVEILADSSDQIASQVVSALVRQTIFAQQGQIAAARAAAQSDRTANDAAESGIDESSLDVVSVRDVLATEKANPRISMYAAGIAVMFLLFSASGAGGTLLEEQEAGTLERLLSSQLSVSQLLAGKWIYITICGALQLLVMFIWAQLVFQVDLVGHLAGFALMAIGTAAAAASLALLLATLCHSRSQLNGISVILILTMSALGGSMVPRYIMSEELQRYGLVTFNAWALDGFDKVFWRDLPLIELKPQLLVLVASAFVMAVAARVFARRWEA